MFAEPRYNVSTKLVQNFENEQQELWIRIQWILIRIRIQHFKWNWIQIQSRFRVLMSKNCRKKIQLKFFFYKSFLSKIAIYLCPSFRRSLQPSNKWEHPALQKMKFMIFFFYVCGSFLFALLDPDPDCGYGSRDSIESGSNPDPDPQHWEQQ